MQPVVDQADKLRLHLLAEVLGVRGGGVRVVRFLVFPDRHRTNWFGGAMRRGSRALVAAVLAARGRGCCSAFATAARASGAASIWLTA
jgi:hypothetical protein